MTEKEITAVMVMPSEEFARKSLGNECEIMQPENQFPRQKSMDGDYMYRFVCPQCGETCMIISESELRKYKRTWELLKMVPLLDELIAEFEDLCGRGYRYIGIFCPNEKGDGKFDTVIMNSEDWKKSEVKKEEQTMRVKQSDVIEKAKEAECPKERVALNEKRLLAIPEFQMYASIGRNNALKLAHESGAAMRIGRRLLIDRVKFDQWCDEQC